MEINIIKVGFLLGIIPRKELINWSEINLEKDKPNDVFLNISMLLSKSTDFEFSQALNDFDIRLTENEFVQFHSILLSFLFKEKEDWENIQRLLLKYFNLLDKSVFDSDYEFWSRLRDDYYLREDGLSGCMRMPSELTRYFKSFEIIDYSESFLEVLISRYPQLNSISK